MLFHLLCEQIVCKEWFF